MQPETEQPLRGKEHGLVFQVRAAQADPAAADALVGQYMPFIRSETYKFTHAPVEAGHEDELSIATLAFYEAALSYQAGRGAFLPSATRPPGRTAASWPRRCPTAATTSARTSCARPPAPRSRSSAGSWRSSG